MEGFIACFEGLEDPRTGNAGRHDLLEILMIALCTVLCGGQTAVDMAEFAEDKEAFLRGFLTLEHGPPSHDTFSRDRRRRNYLQLCRLLVCLPEALQSTRSRLPRQFELAGEFAASDRSTRYVISCYGV